MPATSKAQQRLFGAVVAAQKGKKAGSSKIATMAKDISKKDAKDFASTPTKNLPNKVKNEAYEFSQAEKDLMVALLKARGATSGVVKQLDKVMPVSSDKTTTDPKFAKLKKLREYIRKKIVKEMNTTGNIEGYDTPYAFTKPGMEKKKGNKQAKLTGYSVVNEDVENDVRVASRNFAKLVYSLVGKPINKKVAEEIISAAGRWANTEFHMGARSGYYKESVELFLTENRWLELKREDSPVKSKIGKGISAINKQLSEVERFLNWYGRLKQESGITGGDFWKRTNHNIYKIKERLIKLEQHIRKFV